MSVKQDLIRNAYTVWYLLTLRRSFEGDPKRIKADQNQKIYRLMKEAYNIPIYREKFEQSGTTPEDYHSAEDLAKFPTLTKPELRRWMLSELEEKPEKRDNTVVLLTSGSSGDPLRILYTLKELACSDANWVRVLKMAGYRPLRGKMYSFAPCYREPTVNKRDSLVQTLGLMRRKLVLENHAAGDGLADMIRDINEYKPDLIVLRRNVLVRLVKYSEEHGLKMHKPKFYSPSGEMVDDLTRSILRKAFGDGRIDAYGLSEMGSFIYEFPGAEYRHVANDIAVANVYNDKNELADEGRIIATALYKHTYPVINYETGDLAKSFVKDGIRYFTDITGRRNDLVKHQDGHDSSGADLMRIGNRTTGITQFRFIEESYHDMLIQLVADPLNKTESREDIERYFVNAVRNLFGDEFKIRIE